MAHYFGLGDYSRGFLDQIPPLFPLLAGLLCKLGISAQYSTHVVSCTFCILTIFPLYFLLCFFMDQKYAAWGCMFYLFAPKILRFGLASQIEGARFFFFVLPIYLMFNFAKNRKIITLIWLGISLALLALVRGEGVLFTPIILLLLVVLLLKGNMYKINSGFIIKTFGYCLLCVIVVLAVITPRICQVYKHTGYPVLDTREASSIQMVVQNTKIFFNLGEREQNTVLEKEKVIYSDPNTYGYFTLERLMGFLDRFSVGTFELYELLFIFGVIFLLIKKDWKLEHNIMLALLVFNASIFYFTALTYRYFLVNIILLTPFIVPGYRLILDITRKYRVVQILFSIMVLVIVLGQIENGMADSLETKRKEPQRFGMWLKEQKQFLLNPKKNSNERLHILVFGKRPDYPFFAGADFSLADDQDFCFGARPLKIKEAVKGFRAKYSYYSSISLSNDHIITPDIIIVTPPEDYTREIADLKTINNLQEVKTHFKEFLLFKNLN